MKNLLLTFALLISSIVFAQKPVLDSMQVFKAIPEKPELVVTLYNYNTLFENLTILSDNLKVNEFIVVFFYKEDENSPQKRMVKNFKRKLE